MGIRQRGYWLRQAGALRRQFIADVSYSVRIGMADSKDYQKAMDDLELTDKKDDLKTNMWDILSLLGGGKAINRSGV
uniref:Uncharacterized protein n=1 Tax=viral metagenome TaxID=1070528 RepID=A0A6M3M3Z0_9ZZZZ